jgi:hypothetical protein
MPQKYAADEVGRRGQKLYDERIRSLVEPGHVGQIVVIDVDTSDYLVGTDLILMSHELRQRHSDAALYALKVGAAAFSRIGARRPARSA